MERLFWKFFFTIWGALLTTGFGVATVVSLLHARPTTDFELAVGPRAAVVIDAAAAVLTHGGVDALRRMLSERPIFTGDRPYAVDARSIDVLERKVPPAALRRARELLMGGDSAADMGGERAAPHEIVRKATAPDQREFILFLDTEPPLRPPHHSEGGPPPHGGPPSPIVMIVAGLLVSLAFSALLAWHFAWPVRTLREGFHSVAEGHLDTRIGPLMGKRRDELADLAQDFDLMARKLQQLLDSQRRLLHDVSHEIRSPLARLQAAIGLARQAPEKFQATLERVEHESVRLDQLVGELLTLSLLESGTGTASTYSIDVMNLLTVIAEDARFEAQNSGRQLVFAATGHVHIKGHPELLHRAFENVVRNAVKYTREGTTVEVSIDRAVMSDRVQIRICDHGPGVPNSDLEAIFTPFHRCDNAEATGFGLGLAIARRAVEMHGGSIRASNRPTGGLCIEIILPAQ